MDFIRDIPKILSKNTQLMSNLENILRNLIIISEFVSVLKSKKTAFNFLTVLVKSLNFILNLKIDSNLISWTLILLKNYLTHLHFEYNRIEISLIDATKLIKIILNYLFSTDSNDYHNLSMLLSICKLLF